METERILKIIIYKIEIKQTVIRKNICIMILFFILSSIANAQLEKPITKGHFIIGGLVSFNKKTTEVDYDNIITSQKHTIFELTPNFAYFIMNRFAVGLQISTTLTNQKENDGHIYKVRSLVLLPYFRYYLYSGFFGEAAIGYGFIKAEEEKATIVNGKMSFGYTVFLNQKVGLEPIVSYARDKQVSQDNNYKSKKNDLKISLSLQVFF